MNSFFTIKSTSDGLFKDKGSRFISFAFPVSSAEEAMAIVKQKRKEFFDARHVCYAYMIGRLIGHISRLEQTRIALELNLVNHIFPSGGVSGISYTSWRMHKLGVSSARSTFAQVIRYVTKIGRAHV